MSEGTKFYGYRVRQARELLGLAQEVFAERVGAHVNVIRAIEGDRAQPRPDILDRIVLVTGFRRPFFFEEPTYDFPLGSLLYHTTAEDAVRSSSAPSSLNLGGKVETVLPEIILALHSGDYDDMTVPEFREWANGLGDTGGVAKQKRPPTVRRQ